MIKAAAVIIDKFFIGAGEKASVVNCQVVPADAVRARLDPHYGEEFVLDDYSDLVRIVINDFDIYRKATDGDSPLYSALASPDWEERRPEALRRCARVLGLLRSDGFVCDDDARHVIAYMLRKNIDFGMVPDDHPTEPYFGFNASTVTALGESLEGEGPAAGAPAKTSAHAVAPAVAPAVAHAVAHAVAAVAAPAGGKAKDFSAALRARLAPFEAAQASAPDRPKPKKALDAASAPRAPKKAEAPLAAKKPAAVPALGPTRSSAGVAKRSYTNSARLAAMASATRARRAAFRRSALVAAAFACGYAAARIGCPCECPPLAFEFGGQIIKAAMAARAVAADRIGSAARFVAESMSD